MNGIPQIFPAPSGGAITGEIRAFVGSLPFGWLECDGSAFDAAKYPRLKTVLGAETLPDLRDASLRGATASSAANTKSGSNNPAVPVPAHNHTVTPVYESNFENGFDGMVIQVESPARKCSFRDASLTAEMAGFYIDSAGVDGATLDVRGSSYYVKFAIYAL